MPAKRTLEEEERLINLINEYVRLNFSQKEIATKLGYTQSYISIFMKKHNIENSYHLMLKKNNSGEFRVCKKCNILKHISNFTISRSKSRPDGHNLFTCNYCRNGSYRERKIKDINLFLRSRWLNIKNNCKTSRIIFSISLEDFISQYNKQDGLCFYTNQKMEFDLLKEGVSRKNLLSVDRVIPEKGYIKNNIVFCAYQVNACKNNLTLSEISEYMPQWYEKIKIFMGNYYE